MMLISAGIQAGTAAYRNIKAQKGLSELEKQRLPQYMDAAAPIQENKQMYGQMARSGMGPGSLNLAKNTFAAGQNALTAAPAGGQLRTQIGRMASANAGGFANQLAAQNEGIRRQGMSGVAQANLGLSGLQQRDIGVGLQRRSEAEKAYGQAIQDSRRELLGAAAGVATGFAGQKNIQENRALARQYYGLKDPNQQTPGNFNPNLLIGPPGQFPTPASMKGAIYPQTPISSMGLGDMSSLPGSMGGLGGDRASLTAGLPVNKANLPFNMGGTGGLRENYAPSFSDISLSSSLPYSMGGTGGLGRNPPGFAGPKFDQLENDFENRRMQQQNYIDQRTVFMRPYPEMATPGYMNTYGAETGPFGQIMFKGK